jgi:hypothetical protein
MKSLKEICPDAAEVVKMDLHKLAHAVLHCVHTSPEPVKRKDLAKNIAEAYPADFRQQVAHAVQEALGWLGAQCLLGASPYDEDLIFVTRMGQDQLTKNGEHPWIPADILP